MKMEGAKKYDEDKPRVDLLPFSALLKVAEVFGYGAEKYGDRNWELGMRWGRLLAASLRHLYAFAEGEDEDPESGLPHLAHAACDVLMLLHYSLYGIGRDDRRRRGDLRIGLDIDGVICDFVGGFRQISDVSVDWTSPDAFDAIPDEEIDRLPLSFWAELRPLVDRLTFTPACYVSGRHRRLRQVTERWLADHGFPRAPLALTGSQDKIAVIDALAPDIFVDDNPRVVMEINAKLDTIALLLDRPWNRVETVAPELRLAGLDELEKYLVDTR